MTPTDTEIVQALDVLDWCTDDQVHGMRDGFERTMRAFQCSLAAGPATSQATTAAAWDPMTRAMLFVIWKTSNEYLEAVFNRS